MIEFFLVLLRRLSRKLKLPVALGTQKLGEHLYAGKDASEVLSWVGRWKSWPIFLEELADASVLLVPVPLDEAKYSRDYVLLCVTGEDVGADESQRDEVLLRDASSFRVGVFDPILRGTLAEGLAGKPVSYTHLTLPTICSV